MIRILLLVVTNRKLTQSALADSALKLKQRAPQSA
jgi:hypothetical protein